MEKEDDISFFRTKDFYDFLKQSPVLGKIFLLTSIVMTANSIASLSDTFIHWVGFVKDSVHFYNEYVLYYVLKFVDPLFVNYFGKNISANEGNFVILLLLQGFAWARMSLVWFGLIFGTFVFCVHILIAALNIYLLLVVFDFSGYTNLFLVAILMFAIPADMLRNRYKNIKHCEFDKEPSMSAIEYEYALAGRRPPDYAYEVFELGRRRAWEKYLYNFGFPLLLTPVASIVLLGVLGAITSAIDKIN